MGRDMVGDSMKPWRDTETGGELDLLPRAANSNRRQRQLPAWSTLTGEYMSIRAQLPKSPIPSGVVSHQIHRGFYRLGDGFFPNISAGTRTSHLRVDTDLGPSIGMNSASG
jgi:hypothetical protein